MKIKERFIDPLTDFGFKKIFGSESNEDLLVDFLNELLKGRKQIKSLTYLKNEQLGKTSEFRKAVFDLYCESENGQKFIIEIQKVKQQYFKDRSIYYSTFPIQEQATEGEIWDYQLKEIYAIGIMDFAFDNNHPEQFQHDVKLVEMKTHEVFYDKLTFIFIELPKFSKKEDELVSRFDKWLYVLKNLNQLREIPFILQDRLFTKIFHVAEVSNLNEEEMKTYEASLKYKRDWKNALDTAIGEARNIALKEGLQEGIEKGMKKGIEKGMKKGMEKGMELRNIEIARNLKKAGVGLSTIAEATGLTLGEIEKL